MPFARIGPGPGGTTCSIEIATGIAWTRRWKPPRTARPTRRWHGWTRHSARTRREPRLTTAAARSCGTTARAEEALDEFERAIEADGEYQPAHLNRIEILIEEFQEHEEALELADDLLQGTLEKPIEAEVYYLKAKALFYLDDLEGALFLLRRAIKLQGEVGIYRGFEGQVLFELGNFDEARRSLERGLALEPDCAHSTYHMALVMEHTGQLENAERSFAQGGAARARALPAADPDRRRRVRGRGRPGAARACPSRSASTPRTAR